MGRSFELSIVVVAYDMAREIPRTVESLATPYQRGVDHNAYEIIVVDNGSPDPLTEPIVPDPGPRVRMVRIEDATPSPGPAANVGLELAEGRQVALFIDGARMASPGLLAAALRADSLHPRAVVATLAWHLGPTLQREAAKTGYDQQVEDGMLERCQWQADGYRLFEISTLAASSQRGWFGPMGESNALFMPADLWHELGGLDERFALPGGGRINHDLFRRACELPESELIVLLGEGTFHQIHGGAFTSGDGSADAALAEYESIRGESFRLARQDPLLIGHMPATARAHLTHSAAWFADRWESAATDR